MKPYLHKAPTFRHPKTKARAMLFPVFGTDKYSLSVFPYKSQTGRDVCMGHYSTCNDWLKANGYFLPV